uniref:IST1 homolog n=1 Tax=Strigamia maritima TaxID=126957 RepID=T1IXH0_STRMM
MLSTGPSYNKLKTNLRLAVNRLKLLEKKKTELAQKARREIADYLANGKDERAKIRVEHIIREDYLVEAMEVVEMYCDLILARFGLIQQMKTLDDGLAEAISSLLWVAPRLQSDVSELKMIADQLTVKYGKQYAQACRENAVGTVNEKLMHKLSLQAPPRILVERYLIEIAKSHNVAYEPDCAVMRQDEEMVAEAMLIDFNENKQRGSSTSSSIPGSYVPPPAPIGFVMPPQTSDFAPFNYPSKPDISHPMPSLPPAMPSLPPSISVPPYDPSNSKPPNPSGAAPPYDSVVKRPPSPNYIKKFSSDVLPELPSVPSTTLSFNDDSSRTGTNPDDDVDFDDLSKRFEELKKRK